MARCIPILSAMTWAAAPGCAPQSAPQSATPFTTADLANDLRTHRQSEPAAQITPIATGRSPLVYLVDRSINVLVLDQTQNRLLTAGKVESGTIISVVAEHGVHFGSRLMAAGPLADDDIFEIDLEPTPTDEGSLK